MGTEACPSEEELAAFASGALNTGARGGVQQHLRECPECFALAARVMGTGASQVAAAGHADAAIAGASATLPARALSEMPPLLRGTMLDRYLVLDRLGAGGMGVVYAAYDAELDRKLAVKLLASGSAGADGRTRLLREAQAMARLSHENVIAVYDVGTVGEQVYVAMELVDGVTLTAWMSERPRGFREVIDMFVPAGRALAAAHAAGIVHRDFKPDNVMIGKDGRVRVLDFGLARAAEETAPAPESERGGPPSLSTALATPLTRSGSLVGTPLYMSPEQWRNQPADARSDQFGYCVALYEALWGVRPFAGDTVAELAAAVLHGEVRPPPAERRVPAWLEQIVRRGLSPDPAARFPAMDALVAQLASDPDATRSRRRRTQLVTGAFVALAGVATFGLVRQNRAGAQRCHGFESRLAGVWDAGVREAMRAAFGKSGKPYAGDTADRVARVLDGYAQSWVKTRVDACEATQVRGDQSERLLDLRVGCLDRRLRELGSLTQLFTAAPDGALVDKAVSAASQLSSLDSCSDAAALQAVVPPPADAARRAQVETLRAQLAEARALENAGQYDRALPIAVKTDDAAAPLAYAPLRAESLFRRGSLEQKKGDAKAAEAHFDAALAQAAEAHDDVLAARVWPALISVVGQDQARYGDANLLSSVAEPALLRAGDDPEARAAFSDVRGRIFGAEGKPAEAQKLFERALALRQKTLPPDDPAIASSLNNIGVSCDEQGKFDQALENYLRALAIREKAFGAGHPVIATNLNNIGIVYKEEGRYEEAAQIFQRALDIDETAFGREHPAVADLLNSLGNVRERQGRLDEALAMHQRALAMREKLLGPTHPRVATSLQNLAVVLFDQKKYDEVQRIYQRVLDIRMKTFGAEHPQTASTIVNMADVSEARGRHAEAVQGYQRALAIFEKSEGRDHPDVGYPLTGLAISEVSLGRFAEAIGAAERALKLRQAVTTARDDLGDTRFVLARALWGQGSDRARALALARQARDDFATTPMKKQSVVEVEAWLRQHGG